MTIARNAKSRSSGTRKSGTPDSVRIDHAAAGSGSIARSRHRVTGGSGAKGRGRVIAHGVHPLVLVEQQREGVSPAVLVELAKRLRLTQSRFFEIIGLPPATGTRKLKQGTLVDGMAGVSALAIQRLIDRATELIEDSVDPAVAAKFDAAAWVGKWIETPMPALDGEKPSAYLDTPAGQEVAMRLLGSVASGSYQ